MLSNLYLPNTKQHKVTLDSKLKILVCSFWGAVMNKCWMISESENNLKLAVEICKNCPSKHLPKGISPVSMQDFFSFHSGISSLIRGGDFCSYFNTLGSRSPQIQATHPRSHCRRFLLDYPKFPTGYPQVFKGENALPAASALLGKTAHLGLFIRSMLLIKDWGKRGRETTKNTTQKSCRAKRKEEKETSFEDV